MVEKFLNQGGALNRIGYVAVEGGESLRLRYRQVPAVYERFFRRPLIG